MVGGAHTGGGAGDEGLARRLAALFLATLTVSATANSGYAILAAMRSDFVHRRQWFSEDEFADLTAIVQSSPGPMAVNASLLVGYRGAGPAGAFAAVLGVIVPPFAVMVAVTLFYGAIAGNQVVALFMRGMQVGVVAMLMDVCLGLLANVRKEGSVPYIAAVMAVSFVYVRFSGLTLAYLVVACAVCGVVRALALRRKAGRP